MTPGRTVCQGNRPPPAGIRQTLRHAIAVLIFCAIAIRPAPTGSADGVDLNLILAIDCSYSVDEKEFDLQRKGLARALVQPDILKAILSGARGRIAITVVQWSSSGSQVVAVPWRRLASLSDLIELARLVAVQKRRTADGGTAIGALIDRGVAMLARAPFAAERHVIDISADGTNNNGVRVDDARDRAERRGVTINGLVIQNEISWLHFYFRNHVITGPGAFVVIANDYDAYSEAIRRKLVQEILGPRLS